jgi:hypothetical protein
MLIKAIFSANSKSLTVFFFPTMGEKKYTWWGKKIRQGTDLSWQFFQNF